MDSSSHSFTVEWDHLTPTYVQDNHVTMHIRAIKNDLLIQIMSAKLKSKIENCEWLRFTDQRFARFVRFKARVSNQILICEDNCRHCAATFEIIEDVEKGKCDVYVTSLSSSNTDEAIHGRVSAEFSVDKWDWWWKQKNAGKGNLRK